MIELLCKDCGVTLDDIDIIALGSSIKIKIEPCDCNIDKDCDNCDRITEIEEEIISPLAQAQIDIEGNDEMIEKIRKVAEKMGGEFQTKIEEILNE